MHAAQHVVLHQQYEDLTKLGLAGLMIFWPVLYFFVFVYYLMKAYYFVHSAPWADFKIANLLVRLHVCPPVSFCPHACCPGQLMLALQCSYCCRAAGAPGLHTSGRLHRPGWHAPGCWGCRQRPPVQPGLAAAQRATMP